MISTPTQSYTNVYLMKNSVNAALLKSDTITFRTDSRTKLTLMEMADRRGVSVSDILNTITKNAIDDEGRIHVGLEEQYHQNKSEEYLLKIREQEQLILQLQKELENAGVKKKVFVPENRFERRIKVVHGFFSKGQIYVHEDEFAKSGVSPWFHLTHSLIYFGPYKLTKSAGSDIWTISKLPL